MTGHEGASPPHTSGAGVWSSLLNRYLTVRLLVEHAEHKTDPGKEKTNLDNIGIGTQSNEVGPKICWKSR